MSNRAQCSWINVCLVPSKLFENEATDQVFNVFREAQQQTDALVTLVFLYYP